MKKKTFSKIIYPAFLWLAFMSGTEAATGAARGSASPAVNPHDHPPSYAEATGLPSYAEATRSAAAKGAPPSYSGVDPLKGPSFQGGKAQFKGGMMQAGQGIKQMGRAGVNKVKGQYQAFKDRRAQKKEDARKKKDQKADAQLANLKSELAAVNETLSGKTPFNSPADQAKAQKRKAQLEKQISTLEQKKGKSGQSSPVSPVDEKPLKE